MPTALITGITGQDGSYLAELLLDKGYEVHGIVRRSSSFNTGRIDHIFDRLTLHYGEMTDGLRLRQVLETVHPDEVYNLAAQSHVRVSFDEPVYTTDVDALGVTRLLEAVRDACRDAKFYQASSSEMFGNAPTPQTEQTPMHPVSPYGCAKLYACNLARMYRDAYGVFVSNGIMFNHESPRRGETFVSRKITRAATRIEAGLQKTLTLGNLDAMRDWGFAGDYVRAMWLMLQQDEPDDFVIATGEMCRVFKFAELAFQQCGFKWRDWVAEDPRYSRPAEVHELQGDARKAKRVLGWEPTVDLKGLVAMMVESDRELARKEAS